MIRRYSAISLSISFARSSVHSFSSSGSSPNEYVRVASHGGSSFVSQSATSALSWRVSSFVDRRTIETTYLWRLREVGRRLMKIEITRALAAPTVKQQAEGAEDGRLPGIVLTDQDVHARNKRDRLVGEASVASDPNFGNIHD